jgi:hypothetical protein
MYFPLFLASLAPFNPANRLATVIPPPQIVPFGFSKSTSHFLLFHEIFTMREDLCGPDGTRKPMLHADCQQLSETMPGSTENNGEI